jgi:hypothetical protein
MSLENHSRACTACRRGLGGDGEAHSRLMGIEDSLGTELGEPLLSQVIAEIEKVSQQTYEEIIELMEENPLAFVSALGLKAE